MINDNKEKVLIYSAIITIIILIIILIIVIWSSSIRRVVSTDINKYEDQIYENTCKEYYINYLSENLKPSNFDILFENISKDYLNEINCLESEDVKKYLIENHLISNSISISDVSYSETDDANYIRVTYDSYGLTKYANIIEETPFKFSIDFQDDISSLNPNNNVNILYNNIGFNFKILSEDSSSIKYEIDIVNNSTHTYEFDFSSITGCQLRYDENNYTNISTLSLSPNDNYTITPGSSKTVNFLYNVPFENQMKIDGFLFANVKEDGEIINIELDF